VTLTKKVKRLETNDQNYISNLDEVIRQVKEEFKNFLAKREELVIKLGKAFENIGPKEFVCAEIKNALREEIAQRLISRRDIERYCPDEWKKKTKPKKEETTNCRSLVKSKRLSHS
jgi:hypothetical protein